MLGWITNKTESLAKRFVRERITSNPAYAIMKWDFLERNILRLSSSPLKSVCLMIVSALLIVCVGYFLESPIKQYLSAYTPYRRSVFEWQTTILSGQLTIIGIVYPLVIGLVSIVFQKKTDRKIAQKAYQLYSGFMLAGLSGLFLSAFVLIGTIVRVTFGDYLYGIVCLISEAWLFINVFLSVWFFIVSLEILDDAKRQSIIKRYIAFNIMQPYVNSKISARLRLYPVYPEVNLSNIEVKLTDHSDGYKPITGDFLRRDIVSLHHRPFIFLLKIINFLLKKKGIYAAIVIANDYFYSGENENKIILSVRNLDPDSFMVGLLKRCFYKADVWRRNDTVNVIMQALTADTFACMQESDLNAFDNASDSLIDNFTGLCDLYYFNDGGVANNFLLITTETFELSVQRSFSNEIYSISNRAVNMIAESERYFELCLWSGLRILNNRQHLTRDELDICMDISRSHWTTLTAWNKNSQPLASATLRGRYDRLIRSFASVWEQYQHAANHRFKNELSAELYFYFCKTQLQNLPLMVIDAVSTRDPVTVDAAVDLLNRWQHSMDIDADVIERYSYQGQLFSPGLFITKNLNCIKDSDWFRMALVNALIDMRVCLSLYLTSRMKQPDAFITHYVKIILQGQLTDQTGGYETRSEKIDGAGQLIKFLIRICLWTWTEKMDHRAWLNQLAQRMSDYDRPDMVSGRTYSGVADRGFTYMMKGWVQILLTVSEKGSRVSHEIAQAIKDDHLTYREKKRIIEVLSAILSETDKSEEALHLDKSVFQSTKNNLLTVVREHIEMLQTSLAIHLHEAVIDTARLSLTARKTTEIVRQRLNGVIPLSLFKITSAVKDNTGSFIKRKVILNTDKESYAEGLDPVHVINEGDVQAECVTKDVQAVILSKLLQCDSSKKMPIEDFSMMIDYIKSSPEMAGKNLLVMSRDVFQNYNNLIFELPDLRTYVKSNRDGSRTVITEFGTCRLFFMPWVNQPVTLVVADDYFSALSLKEYEGGNLVNVTSENVRSESDRFDLILNYEVSVTFKGEVDLRMVHCLNKETV